MQMGMIGNLWVYPSQAGTDVGGFTQFAYNDVDKGFPGTTGYHVEYPVQITGFDRHFHDAHIAVQPLPFAAMDDNYPMLNGRGYPDTINTDVTAVVNVNGYRAQPRNSLIQATAGQRILLRVSNVSTTDLISLATTLGVPMRVVGRGAEMLVSDAGINTAFEVSVLNVGGGQAYDVLIDTTGVSPGTYFLYSTNLHFLTNFDEERGGYMTEIVLN